MKKTLIKRAAVALLFLLCQLKPLLTTHAESIEGDLEDRLGALKEQLTKTRTNLAAHLGALEDDLQQLLNRQRALEKRAIPGALIPVGAMIPYFGKHLPEGFVWADGCADSADGEKAECSWPEQLLGEGVPNMAGTLLGGAHTPEEVGSVWNSGKIQTPEYEVKGESFSLPEARNQTENIELPKDSWFLKFEKREESEDQSDAEFHNSLKDFTKKFESTKQEGKPKIKVWMKLVQAGGTYQNTTYPDTTIQGSQTLGEHELGFDTADANPRHLRCRWIIRIK